MNGLHGVVAANAGLWLALGGLVIGACFGAIVARTNFCAMGSIADISNFGDWRRFRAWMLALATAVLGARALDGAGIVALKSSMYLDPGLNWLGAGLGGLMFGTGMVLAGGCGGRNLARFGGGDLRAGFTLMMMAVFAYMTLGGLLGPARAAMERWSVVDLRAVGLTSQSLGEIVGQLQGMSATPAEWMTSATLALVLAAFTLGDRTFRASNMHVLSGIGVGLCVVAGWALTGLAADEFAARVLQPTSLTFVRPTADAIDWLERFTASMVPGFGVTSVLGAILGAGLVRFSRGDFRLQTFASVADTGRTMAGAALMGVGGVMALGCTIGQGITGASTLSLGSLIALAAIIAGGFTGMRLLEALLEREV